MCETPRVLVVDDDTLSRTTAEALLQPMDYRLRGCASGEEALEAVEEEVPDLVLLDVLMPGMDGFEVCRRLRERLHPDYVPVILVTAMDDRRDLVQGLEVGADDFLRKPVHGAELRARVSNLLKVRAYHRLLASERDHALATVEQLRQQVLRVDRLAMLGTFAAGVSHELNNIAHVLRSALELSRPGITPPPVGGEELNPRELFTHVSNHVTELSRTLLRIARPDEGPVPEANLCRVLEEVDQMLRLTGRTRHAHVSLVLSREDCRIRGNPVHAQQVFLNLLGNAADAVTAVNGPTIEAGVQRKVDGRIEAWVKDNGPGMTQEVLARIFEPFFTTKPPGSGTGLGLPVVRQLVESWGGHLQVESQPGSGTRMVLDLPAALTP
ncbi:sensor histidine kinase [Hyalangium minutum]|nr:hybrid sensor histidine kinase/response regulator [Hyalangium minutum]